MVKFSKQLEGQLVAEWRPAYMNYKYLKKDLKGIKATQQLPRKSQDSWSQSFRAGPNFFANYEQDSGPALKSTEIEVGCPPSSSSASGLNRMQESFVALTGHAAHAIKNKSLRTSRAARDVIQVELHKLEGDESHEVYETLLLEPFGHLDSERSFLSRLDRQFNKVNQFYRSKEKDFVDHAAVLEKQMQSFVEMRKGYEDSQEPTSWYESRSLPSLATSKISIVSTRSVSESKDTSDECLDFESDLQSYPSVDLEAGVSDAADMDEDSDTDDDSIPNSNRVPRTVEFGAVAPIPECSPLKEQADDIVDGSRSKNGFERGQDLHCIMATGPHMTLMKMNMSLSTPSAAISPLISQRPMGKNVTAKRRNLYNKEAEIWSLSGRKKKIAMAEKMLRTAFVEYYRGLNMLKSYSSLNMVAFAKILKKHDKVSGHRASVSSTYLRAVEASYFNTSDRVVKLMEKVETLFTNYFAKYDRQKAMMSLRPQQKKASHTVTFILGLFSGGSLALFGVFAVLVHVMLPKYISPTSVDYTLKDEHNQNTYVKTIFPIFSMVALILIHMYMYGANLYFWRRMRINYSFIFEFSPGTELRHREVLMATSILTTFLIGAMVGHLALHSTASSPYVDFIPFGVVMMLVIWLFFPLNIYYRSSRVFFLNSMLHIIGSPLYKVVLADFFLADQLTSQVPMLRNLQYCMCYYFGGFFMTGDSDACFGNKQYQALIYLVSLLPYWWRLMQCMRRYRDESDWAHIANGGKYLSALVAVALRIQYGRHGALGWLILYILSSTVATIYQLYWDLVVDWGLLRKDSKNKWLRDELIMPKKKHVYFISMVVNAVLRLAWLQSIARFRLGVLESRLTDFLFAALEVVRRGHWNFYRLENEHLNNVGKYRATKTVPLPFEDPTAEDF